MAGRGFWLYSIFSSKLFTCLPSMSQSVGTATSSFWNNVEFVNFWNSCCKCLASRFPLHHELNLVVKLDSENPSPTSSCVITNIGQTRSVSMIESETGCCSHHENTSSSIILPNLRRNSWSKFPGLISNYIFQYTICLRKHLKLRKRTLSIVRIIGNSNRLFRSI